MQTRYQLRYSPSSIPNRTKPRLWRTVSNQDRATSIRTVPCHNGPELA